MVSVIIPTYNREKTLLRSINSVLSQTYSDLELIIVDDCSTDSTCDLVNRISDPRVRYIRLEENQGACVARNTGIDMAKGEYIAFQDSDDVWLPDKLEKQLEIMRITGADVCFHRMRRHYPSSKKRNFFPNLQNSKFLTHEEMCNNILASTQTIIGIKNVFHNYTFDPLVRKAQDYDWAIRASREFSFYYLNEILVEQYIQHDSISNSGWKTIKETRSYFLEKYKDEFFDNPQFELYQLCVIARAKALLGENPIAECKHIYKISPSMKTWICIQLSRLRLIKIAYIIKGYKP